jgi:ribosomal protein S10
MKNRLLIIVMTTSVFLASGLLFQNKLEKTEKQSVQKTTLEIKNSLLSSEDINLATFGFIFPYFTAENVNIVEWFPNSYFYDAYGVELTHEESKIFERLIDYAFSTPGDYIRYDSNRWLGYYYAEGVQGSVRLLTKNGYGCMYHLSYDSHTNTLVCVNLENIRENTIENVSAFIKKSFKEAGLDCSGDRCLVQPRPELFKAQSSEGHNEAQEAFPFPQYSRDIIEVKVLSDQEGEAVKQVIRQEMNDSASALKEAGWEVNLSEYTQTEQSWSKETVLSQRIAADNSRFSCSHIISLLNIEGVYKEKHNVHCQYQQ